MAKPDKVFQQAYAWFRASVARGLAASPMPAADQARIETLIWQLLGVINPSPPPADPDIADFNDSGAHADSLARAAQIVAESLVALATLKTAVDALRPGGNPAAALGLVRPVMQQIEALTHDQPAARYPSAFSIAKMLLTLSGDAQPGVAAAAGHEADQLAALAGATTPQQIDDAQTALAILTLVIGSVIDRSFSTPIAAPATGWGPPQVLPPLAGLSSWVIPALPGLGLALEFDDGAPSAIQAALALNLDRSSALGGGSVRISLTSGVAASVRLPVLPLLPVSVSGALDLALDVSRTAPGGALLLGSDALGATLVIGELGMALRLANGAPRLGFFARKVQARLKPTDVFLKLILGDGIRLDLDIEAEADSAGQLRLKNGTGLKASLPVPSLPTGPFSLQGLSFALQPDGGSFLKLKVELSASFGVELGPFQASVDRLGMLLELNIDDPARPLGFAFKMPNGIGLALDAGIVKGGGYLALDSQGFAGTLELKMLAIGVKAIAILNTRSEAGFSLLLLIFGQFPAVQLSFGFTLTGVGGLIGVQHTASPTALSQGIGNGSLDAVLFPANPVGDAPRIIATLRTLFPVKRGGFVIGPMLELGWGTPSLVTVRLGLLIEASQFVILGQAIVQLPPLVSADLALLYLRLDFVGSVVFDPLRIAFDAKLVNSRVAFISITGQFAFRAQFGNQPTFLISAGGFHPRFKEIPSDIPTPFDRVGASFDIGPVGVAFKGYFAITSATIQAGSDLRMWADIGIASIEGGYGFDAICYLVPKFYFQVDLHAYLAVHVFGKDFASIHLEGLLAGPGRWHIAGRATVHMPWPLPKFPLHIDEAWGVDRETPQVTVNVADGLQKEISKIANWSAQLPKGGEGYLTLASIQADGALLAHPLGSLVFQQKLVPLGLRLAKASGSKIDGANEFLGGALQLSQGAAPAEGKKLSTRTDFFAAAQFLEMSQDDRMAKPSFEAFAAGYEMADDGYDIGPAVGLTLGYEEADLGAARRPRKARRLGTDTYLEAKHGALMRFGAAGLSPLRDRAAMQPAMATALRVNPAPVIVTDKSGLQPVAGASLFASVWQAEQMRAFEGAAAVKATQVADWAEVMS